MHDFLICAPSVFVIGTDYELLVLARENGLLRIEIDGVIYDAENSGVLFTERRQSKIRVPQTVLDRAGKYRVIYRRSVERRAYGSVLGEERFADFTFRALPQNAPIHIYHLADIHGRFALAAKTAGYFGEQLDLLVINGDLGEPEDESYFERVCTFLGEISGGRLPILWARGNHDTRGRLAERYADYFPVNGQATYYSFSVGPLVGVVLDCGEDKLDTHAEYGGVNRFDAFRRRELDFLRRLPRSERPILAISHACPAQTTQSAGDCFDIERTLYTEWNAELARIGVRLMLSGHVHKAYVLEKNDGRSLLPHDYRVVVGSELHRNDLWGAALILDGTHLTVRFTNAFHDIQEQYEMMLD